jgi:hypothetical protein
MTASDDERKNRALVEQKDQLAERPGDPPVVARMVIEIRSDGTRTVARGAMEDVASGERVAIEARGTTPMALAASLAKTIFSAPMLARHAVRALIQARTRRGSED